jgi:hypothetical protein
MTMPHGYLNQQAMMERIERMEQQTEQTASQVRLNVWAEREIDLLNHQLAEARARIAELETENDSLATSYGRAVMAMGRILEAVGHDVSVTPEQNWKNAVHKVQQQAAVIERMTAWIRHRHYPYSGANATSLMPDEAVIRTVDLWYRATIDRGGAQERQKPAEHWAQRITKAKEAREAGQFMQAQTRRQE